MRLMIVTNDGTVFREETGIAENMFAGRLTEVINLKRKLSIENEVSIKIISGKYGLMDGNDMISKYDVITDSKKRYEEVFITDVSEKLRRCTYNKDNTMIFVPKEMMRLMIDNDALKGNITAVTHPDFENVFKEKGWTFYERRGARIGKENMRNIISSFSCS